MSRWALLALLPATVMIGAATDHEENAPAAAVPEPALVEAKMVEPRLTAEPRALETPGLEVATLRRAEGAREPLDAFETRSWYVPPPPPPPAPATPQVVLPPPPPTAPPLPFTFLGQYHEDDRELILLMRGERMLLVKRGEVIDGSYRVEGIQGRQLNILYLPLGIRQTLDVEAPG
jgi:hypothetical protein